MKSEFEVIEGFVWRLAGLAWLIVGIRCLVGLFGS
jgi:hypothetical protein